MKKVLIIALTLCVLLVLFAGCGSSGDDAESVNIPYEKGILTENGFESKYLGIRFTAPEGFVMATEDYIFSLLDIGADMMMGESSEFVDYAKLATVYEMMVSAPDGWPNVIVMVEKLEQEDITVEQYFDILKGQFSSMPSVNYGFSDITSVEIAGQTYQQMVATGEANDMAATQKYILRKIDDRIVGFITTNGPDTESELDILMGAFTKY